MWAPDKTVHHTPWIAPDLPVVYRFTGIDSWPLCQNGEWIESMSQPVNAYDAGTDTGPSFTSPDMPNSNFGEIFSFGGVMPKEASIFYNPDTCASPMLASPFLEGFTSMEPKPVLISCSATHEHFTRLVLHAVVDISCNKLQTVTGHAYYYAVVITVNTSSSLSGRRDDKGCCAMQRHHSSSGNNLRGADRVHVNSP